MNGLKRNIFNIIFHVNQSTLHPQVTDLPPHDVDEAFNS